MSIAQRRIELSIVMPCLNEVETLAICIQKALRFLDKTQINGEIIIADNGSTDGSQAIAQVNQARVVHVSTKGYGAALQAGIQGAKGKYIIMGDADDSYDFENLEAFILKLREGYDLVVGNRFKGGIKKGAMPFLHRYLGNPVLSFIGKLFFRIKINDFHCGLRGFSKAVYDKLNLCTTGMEFASEMIVKAQLNHLKMTEVPTVLSPDGRTRPPHLRTWRDGWRHLRFLLMFAPNWLFLYPSIWILSVSLIFGTLILRNPIQIQRIIFDIHSLICLSFGLIIGLQFLFFHFFVKIYSVTSGLVPEYNSFTKIFRYFNLERGILIGCVLLGLGFFQVIQNFYVWWSLDFKDLNPVIFVRKVITGIVPFTIGIQIIINSFIFSIIGLSTKNVAINL